MSYINSTPIGVKIPTEMLASIDQMAYDLNIDRFEALNLFLLQALDDKKVRQMVYNRVYYLRRKNVFKYRSKFREVTTVSFKMSYELYDRYYHIDKIYDSPGFSTLALRVAYESIHLKDITGKVIGRILDGK